MAYTKIEPLVVDAYQWTGESTETPPVWVLNLIPVELKVGLNPINLAPLLQLTIKGTEHTVNLTDFILLDEDGYIRIVTATDFVAEYEEILP